MKAAASGSSTAPPPTAILTPRLQTRLALGEGNYLNGRSLLRERWPTLALLFDYERSRITTRVAACKYVFTDARALARTTRGSKAGARRG